MEEEFDGLMLDQIVTLAAEAYHGGEEHPYERLSDLVLVMLDQLDTHESDASRGSEGAARMAAVLRSAIIELRIAADRGRSLADRRFFAAQGVRTIRRYMETD